MKVLGVDPGSRATGYGVIDTGPVARMLAGGVIRPTGSDLAPRLLVIYEGLTRAIAEHEPEIVAVESVFNARNPRSSLILGHARGVALLAGASAGLPVVEYAPRAVKSALTGNGGAAKEQVRAMVVRLLRLGSEPPLDLSDALAVALTHAGRSGRAGPPR